MRVMVILVVTALVATPAGAQTGTFVRLHEDVVRPDGSLGGRYRHFVVSDHAGHGPRAWIEVAPPTEPLETGDRAQVAPLGDVPGRARAVTEAPTALAGPTGAQRALLIVFTFNDQPLYTAPLELWRAFLDDEVSPRFAASSYGRLTLAWDVMGPYVIPLSKVGCPWASAQFYADRAAAAAGADIAAYGRIVYFFPQVLSCPFVGLGTLGGTQGHAWLNGSAGYMLDHELGHTLGLAHSHACPPARLIPGQPCTPSDRGDATDVMGGSTGQFNPYQKSRLGWLGVSGTPPMIAVTRSGDYTLDRYETPGVGAKALKIPRGTTYSGGATLTGTTLYVKRSCGVPGCSRQSFPIPPGINIYLNDGQPAGSYLIDTTPATPEYLPDNELLVGETWTDAGSGIAITLVAADDMTTRVRVVLPSSVLPPPPPPPPGDVTLTLTRVSAPGREMTFTGTLAGATALAASVDGTPVAARYVVVDATRKTWTVKATALVAGAHAFVATVPGTTVSVSTTVVVPR